MCCETVLIRSSLNWVSENETMSGDAHRSGRRRKRRHNEGSKVTLATTTTATTIAAPPLKRPSAAVVSSAAVSVNAIVATKIDTVRLEAMKNAIFAKEREVVASKARRVEEPAVTESTKMSHNVSNRDVSNVVVALLPLKDIDEDVAGDDDDEGRSEVVDFHDETNDLQRDIIVARIEEIDESSPSSHVPDQPSLSVNKDSIATSGAASFSRYPQTPRSQPVESIDSVVTSMSAFGGARSPPSPLPSIQVAGPTEFSRNNAIVAWLERREEEDRAEQKRVIHLRKAVLAVRDADFEIRAGAQALVLRGIGPKIATMIDDALNHYDLCAEMSAPFVVPRSREMPLAPVFVAPDSVQAIKSMSLKVSVPTRHSYGVEIEQAVVGGGAQQLAEALDAKWYGGAGRESLGLAQTLSQ